MKEEVTPERLAVVRAWVFMGENCSSVKLGLSFSWRSALR